MIRFGMVILLSVTLFLAGTLVAQVVIAQDFPYSVPKAPEFDNRGNQPGTGSTEAPDSRHHRHSRRYPQQNGNNLRYESARPYVPENAPPAPTRRRSSRSHGYYRRPGPPAMASQPSYQAPPPPQVQERPDCSRYPMMIAQARNEPEMRNTARQYLTCLLKNGWQMDQARQQVISTIESTYRFTR
ncbi:MAG: hypothetical protein WBG50_13760 [Desulfomonilaceae bacterium]